MQQAEAGLAVFPEGGAPIGADAAPMAMGLVENGRTSLKQKLKAKKKKQRQKGRAARVTAANSVPESDEGQITLKCITGVYP